MEIASTGLVCSVGWNAASACAAIRAGVSGFEELPFLDDEGEPIVGARVRRPDGVEPHAYLLAKAIADCISGAEPLRWEDVPLLVGIGDEGRPDHPPELSSSILPFVGRELGIRFHPAKSGVIPGEHTAGFRALAAARELLADAPACLVAGVDSYLNRVSLSCLAAAGRLKTGANSDGVIPGEAAAAVLLRKTSDASAVRVTGLGFATESVTVYSPEPLLGLGIAEAAKGALAEAAIPMHEIDFRLSDLAGESYAFREQSLLVNRLLRVRRESLPLWHCADSIGDTGAAAGVVQLVLVRQAFRRGYAPGRRALWCTSAPLGDRAVAVIEG